MNQDSNLIYQKESILKIDPAAIAHNLNVIRSITKGKIIAVVKENGYGMGLYNEYSILKDLHPSLYAVTNASEALALRSFGCEEDILLMSPVLDSGECLALLNKDILFMLGSEEEAALLGAAARETGRTPRVHLKIDTGMGRYGFFYNRLPDLKSLTEWVKVEGCYTHLAGKPKNYEKNARLQADRFRQALDAIRSCGIDPGLCHISNSQAVMTLGDLGFDAVRVGSALIGKAASGGQKLKTALWIEARIYQKFQRKKGDTIGYQSTARLKRDSTLGLIRVGHSDGVFLAYGDTPEKFIHGCLHLAATVLLKKRYQKCVYLAGRPVPLIGRLGIAHMVIDLTDVPALVGDVVKIPVNPLLIHPFIPKEFVKE
jgi:alanine racemase